MNELALVPAAKTNGNRTNGNAVAPETVFQFAGIKVKLSEQNSVMRLQGRPLAQAMRPSSRRDLVDRFFALPTLASLRLNPRQGVARLRFDGPDRTASEVLEALAFAMRSRVVTRLPLAHAELLLEDTESERIEIHRVGHELTFWRIDAPSPGHFRLSHPLLHLEIIRERIFEELGTLPDVIGKAPSTFRSQTIRVRVNPHRIEPALFVEVLDPVIARWMSEPSAPVHVHTHEALINTNLVLAPISDFLFPPLGIANALLVWSINRSHIRPAYHDLRQGRTGVELLYLCIGTMTILTFSFFGAAVMYWFLLFWPRQTRELRQRYESAFLTRFRRLPRRVWVESGSSVVERPTKELDPESVIVLTAGDLVPGDGRVLSGEAKIDERWVAGTLHPAPKTEGDTVYATSEVIEGELRMRITAHDVTPVAGRLADWHRDAFLAARARPETRAQHFADHTVTPVLLVGLLALTRGGLHAAKAAIRPDYLNGPMLAENLADTAATLRAAGEGILLGDTTLLETLVSADCLVLDDSVAWRDTDLSEGPSFADLLHSLGLREVVYLAEQSSHGASRVGFDSYLVGYGSEAKQAYIVQRQNFGCRVVYIGNCHAEAIVAAKADLAINVLQAPFTTPLGPLTAILGPDLIKIARLLVLAQDLLKEYRTARGISTVPNVISTLGALYLHTSVSTSVLLTNLGTMANYLRYRSALRSTELI